MPCLSLIYLSSSGGKWGQMLKLCGTETGGVLGDAGEHSEGATVYPRQAADRIQDSLEVEGVV